MMGWSFWRGSLRDEEALVARWSFWRGGACGELVAMQRWSSGVRHGWHISETEVDLIFIEISFCTLNVNTPSAYKDQPFQLVVRVTHRNMRKMTMEAYKECCG